MSLVVAEITKDHIFSEVDDADSDATGRQFDYISMCEWWGWNDLPAQPFVFTETPKVPFKLYDDQEIG